MLPEEPAELVDRGEVGDIRCGVDPSHEDVLHFVADMLELSLHVCMHMLSGMVIVLQEFWREMCPLEGW
jgi:glutamate synthase domain-containing protein 3